MERDDHRVVITKRLLKESLLQLLQKKELNDITVTELCREAGINRATFYRHYKIPKDVLMEILQELLDHLRQQMDIPLGKDHVRVSLERLSILLYEHWDLLRILFQNDSDSGFSVFLYEIYREIVLKYLGRNVQQRIPEQDLHFLMLYHAGGAYSVQRGWILGPDQKSPNEMTDFIYQTLRNINRILMAMLSEFEK